MPSDAEYAAMAYGRGDYSPEVTELMAESNKSIAALLAWVNRLEDLFRQTRERLKQNWDGYAFDKETERLITETKESII